MNTQDTPWWRCGMPKWPYYGCVLLCWFVCSVLFVLLNWMLCGDLVHWSYSYIHAGNNVWYMFWAAGTTGNVDAIPYKPGEYYQSVYVHHHYKVAHLAERHTLLCLIICTVLSWLLLPGLCMACVLFSS